MSGSLLLNGTWGLTYTELMPDYYTGTALRGRELLPAAVPAAIQQVLLDAGVSDDLNIGLNTLKARWVEEVFWIYRHTFIAPAEIGDEHVWLCFDRLELEAVVWLNGEEVGSHANANRPARFNVTGKLRAGENLLVVKISSGRHSASDKPAANYASGDAGLINKRHWHRHPQYQNGWDWHPWLVNVGILGDVRLEWCAVPRLGEVTVFAIPTADLDAATFYARATIDHPGDAPIAATLRARIVETGQEACNFFTIAPGESRQEIALALAHPRLWWPIQHGEQFRYTVEVTLEAGGETQVATRKTGVRRVEMDQSPHPVEGRYCTLRINNRPIFCKGGNWVPADILYSSVPAERTRSLVAQAVAANFNMLRVWGGGLFADQALCEACDEAGVLIWHDFLFACAKFPGDDPAFTAEVCREVTYAVRELAHHPALVVWCGNNEVEWGDWGWGFDNSTPTHPHYAIFHYEIPRIVREEDPSTLHWVSSPWSPEYKFPNDPTVGDQHPWDVSLGQAGPADWWHYRGFVDRFPNEGGILGASSPATLRQFLPKDEQHLLSLSWNHHDNPFAMMGGPQGDLGHAYQTVQLWLGRNPLAMSLDDYAFASGLLQAEGLCEYIANYRRRMFSSASAIFWMYNDSWPVTHGWTIVDYYLRKKLAYHPVRRSFQPVTTVVAEEEGAVTVYGINDTPREWHGALRCGLFRLDGEYPLDLPQAVVLPANASTPLATFPRAQWESLGLSHSGAFAVLSQGDEIHARHRLFLTRFKELEFADPHIHLALLDGVLTLSSPTFVWGVCLDVDGEMPLADNCFDLLPGIPYRLPWRAEFGEPVIRRLGSRDAFI